MYTPEVVLTRMLCLCKGQQVIKAWQVMDTIEVTCVIGSFIRKCMAYTLAFLFIKQNV